MNTLFKSLYDSVIVNTNRPNLRTETVQAIQQETLAFHNRGRFRADAREVLLTSTNGGQLHYKFQIPQDKRIREILAIRPVSPNGQYGRPIPKRDLFQSDPDCSISYSWAAGALDITLPFPATTFALGYLAFPLVDPNRFESWIADRYPHYITDAATARILALRGKRQGGYFLGRVGEVNIPGSHIYNLIRENEEIN